MQKKEKFKLVLKTIAVIILIVILILAINFIFRRNKIVRNFSNQTTKTFEENKNPNFRIGQILLYSSADATDYSQNKDLQDLSISQFTDIAIYIENDAKEELSEANTINKIYIDNIKIESKQENPDFKFEYKNPQNFGKFEDLTNKEEKIEFETIHSNEEDNKDYSTAKFFTDCSNPITLGFVNSNIVQHFKMEEQNKLLSFNGSILELANVDLEKITPKISFEIHILNNLNEEYFCKVFLNVDLKNSEGSINSGYIILLNNYSGNEHSFIKVENN